MIRFGLGNLLATGFGTALVYVNSALDPAATTLDNIAVWGIGAVLVAFVLIQREVSRVLKGVDTIGKLEARIIALEAKAEGVEALLREFMEQHRVLLEQNGQNNHRRR